MRKAVAVVSTVLALAACGKKEATATDTSATPAAQTTTTAAPPPATTTTAAPVLSAAPGDTTVECDSVPAAATLTATETGGLTTLGAISSNPAIASVAPAGSNTFTVTGVASGSCTITVMDHKKNTFPVPVTVQ